MSKTALITGITGQDGAYLANNLLNRGYTVHGIKRRSSQLNTQRVDYFYRDPHASNRNFILHYGDLTDASNMIRLVQEIKPDEIYNLGGQSHVRQSFDSPEYTADVNALGPLRMLEAIRILDQQHQTRFYQASTSELFGLTRECPQTEGTVFHPRSPYGVAKQFGYWITKNYRESYNLFAANGILFNHESPLRGETFVTRKITRAVAHIKCNLTNCLYLGNLDALRDWGHARDFAEGMRRILNTDIPDDFVIATGVTTSVRAFAQMAFAFAGINLEFRGSGPDEIGVCTKTNRILIRVDPAYFRPAEVDHLCGNGQKIRTQLAWRPLTGVQELCREMVEADLYRTLQELGSSSVARTPVEFICHEKDSFLTWMQEEGIDSFSSL